MSDGNYSGDISKFAENYEKYYKLYINRLLLSRSIYLYIFFLKEKCPVSKSISKYFPEISTSSYTLDAGIWNIYLRNIVT